MFRFITLVLLLASFSLKANMVERIQQDPAILIGAEINPVTFIASSDSRVSINFGLSLFNRNKSTEIAIPVDYKNIQADGQQFTAFTISGHYRKFLEKDISGYYFSGVTRITTVNSDTTKLGVGFGIGYRKRFNSGLYWGWGVILGRYVGDNDAYETGQLSKLETLEDNSLMFDMEFLKVGMTF